MKQFKFLFAVLVGQCLIAEKMWPWFVVVLSRLFLSADYP